MHALLLVADKQEHTKRSTRYKKGLDSDDDEDGSFEM